MSVKCYYGDEVPFLLIGWTPRELNVADFEVFVSVILRASHTAIITHHYFSITFDANGTSLPARGSHDVSIPA